VGMAVRAMKQGAYDFIEKPVDLDGMSALIKKALSKRGLKAIAAIYEASKEVMLAVRTEAVLPVLARLAARMLQAEDVSIMLRRGDGLELIASHGLDSQISREARRSLGERLLPEMLRRKKPLCMVGPLRKDSRFADLPGLEDISGSVVVPLIAEGQTFGLLNANRKSNPEAFTISDQRNMTMLGSYIASTLYNAKIRLELVESGKLAAVGRATIGVVHELSNALTGIFCCAQILLQGGKFAGEEREDLEIIVDQGRQCRRMIQNLLKFSRKSRPKREKVGIASCLRFALKLMKHSLSSAGVRVFSDWPNPSPQVFVDPRQLQQVFLNLLTNACHAMESSGVKVLYIRVEKRGGKVLIHFQDTGCGVRVQDLGRLFDPFFTTKAVGKGTGLGLSICRQIISEHEGALRVSSRVGEGTTITIELPDQDRQDRRRLA